MTVPLSYFLFEIFGLVMLAICAVFRIRKKDLPISALLLELFVILAFGMTLEILSVLAGNYKYPPFTMMVLGVPLIIGIGWSVIIFSAMWLTDSLNLPEWSRSFFDAFLAILIDLNMDAVAIRDIYMFDSTSSGMWSWGIPLNAEWFGVPWYNFAGWWFVAFSISITLRLARYLSQQKKSKVLKSIYPILAYFLALGLLISFGCITMLNLNLIVFIVQLSLSISIIAWKWRGIKNPITIKTDFPIYFIPLIFHLSFLGLMIIKGYYIGALPILWTSIIVLIIHVGILIFATKLSNDIVIKG